MPDGVDLGPAGGALIEEEQRVLTGVDEVDGVLAQGGKVVWCYVQQKHGPLDAVTCGLQKCGHPGTPAVLADVLARIVHGAAE